MDAVTVATLGLKVLEAQRAYFKERTRASLLRSIGLEKELSELCWSVLKEAGRLDVIIDVVRQTEEGL